MILATYERGAPENPENWPSYALIWPHLRASGALESEDPAVRQLVSDMARYICGSLIEVNGGKPVA